MDRVYSATVNHFWWLEEPVYARTVFGARLLVNPADYVGRCIYYFGIWEPNLTAWLTSRLHPGELFVDVGANIGYYSVLAAHLGCQVLAVEPIPQTLVMLRKNVAGLTVRVAPFAAGERDESLTLFTDNSLPEGRSTTDARWAQKCALSDRIEISARPLTSILTPEELVAVRVMKIDVEGSEWNVLKGMLQLLEKDIEFVIEITPGPYSTDVLRTFQQYGFHAYRIPNDYSTRGYTSRTPPISPERFLSETVTEQTDFIFSRH